MSGLRIEIGHSSLEGRRQRNEDYVGACTPEGGELESKGIVLVVADGVGGHARGREAAEMSVRNLLNDYYATPDTWGVAKSLDTVLGAINRWLLAYAHKAREYAGMATTLSAVVLRGSRYHLAHVGDSRIYLLRGGVLSQLTEDHTWEHPEFANVLRRAIGLDAHLTIDHADGESMQGDRFVLLTDGVWGTLGEAGVLELLARHPGAEAAADALALEAIRRGSVDNCSALVADVLAVPQGDLRDMLSQAQSLPLLPRLKPGQRIDGLEVIEVLHESRLTLLYRVRLGNESLVLKTLRPEIDDAESIAALGHEEWLARRVVAPCFPQVVGHPARAHLYYLMTWHEGESLKMRLARGHRFGADEVAQLGLRLLKAIGALHRLGIVHRDIKPDNLQLGPKGQLTVLDLGVAASDGVRLREINNPGTPSYMAPELFAGEAANESSDLYACGVTLYELLTRKYPYGEIEPFQTPRFSQPVPPTRYRVDTPAWLEAVLLKACARAPQDRFETAEEFVLALERGAHRPLASPRRIPLAARRPLLLLKILLIMSLLCNMVLLYRLSGPPEPAAGCIRQK
ncbi:MAG TPA: bifunctional protein-serine/threonine kinase/phosphatase [Rhodocyclaceae bacterium]|nr:bifunctional protein-serine/threonine kinase/phosphatase [Rhodocyclaceae bacterium]